MEWMQVFTLAGKEFRDRLRNRWVLVVALVFTVFSLVITYFGGAQQGQVGQIVAHGRHMLNERVSGSADDINVRYAYRPELRVHGIQGLRVADASAMPSIVGAHINACVLMIAEPVGSSSSSAVLLELLHAGNCGGVLKPGQRRRD